MKTHLWPERWTLRYTVLFFIALCLLMLVGRIYAEKVVPEATGYWLTPYVEWPQTWWKSRKLRKFLSNEAPPDELLEAYDTAPGKGRARVEVFHTALWHRGYAFRDEVAVFGVPEYYGTPAEFVAKKAGDCDEHASVRYAVLKARGHRAYILTGYSLLAEFGHAVTLVMVDGAPYVLDISYPDEVLPLSQWQAQEQFLPTLLVDENGVWPYLGVENL